MDGYGRYGAAEDDWKFSNSTVIDYHHQPPPSSGPAAWQGSGRVEDADDFNQKLYMQLQVLSGKITQDQLTSQLPQIVDQPDSKKLEPAESIGMWTPAMCVQETTPFPATQNTGLDGTDDMDISDDETTSQNKTKTSIVDVDPVEKNNSDIGSPVSLRRNIEVTSGAAFYKGLILYIPPFEQLSNTYRGSPAVKMLYASFEFSFGIPVKITTSPRKNSPDVMDATVYFQNNILATGSGWAPHVEASVRALELLSETCYTIQAKGDYFQRCKLLDAENMKTLNLKKWEAVSQKYPKLIDITKESHIQKTFAVFLDNHTSSGVYEDMVCYNLTNQDVNNIKCVVEFFHLTMLPCAVSTSLSKKHTSCVVSIHKYKSAQALLEIMFSMFAVWLSSSI
ncbi:uncharacterized protein LOC124360098 isoform X3 [Homalodisca vitripennis]|uniref:uncharacterized protein LOC124360098 isoform X3 n=1 Tax=Homalodisca vitripennis TaxID=197043 RepID=UPI001EEBB45A|nr:uncharacterized protein LOC124360098 isoform X3 [Homalodisca vitripennis]